MGILEVADIIGKIASGLEEQIIKSLDDHRDFVVFFIREQLYSGLNGEEKNLRPTYDDDDFFNEPGKWYHRAMDYKVWKARITPPRQSNLLGFPARLLMVPNLYIDGTFFNQINAFRRGNVLVTDPGVKNGPDIVAKYGENILDMGPTAIEYFNKNFLYPELETFFKECGYR